MAVQMKTMKQTHDCPICKTEHVDGEPCDPATCEHHDYEYTENGWMECIYCGHETESDDDGDDQYEYDGARFDD